MTASADTIRNQRGFRQMVRHRWDCRGTRIPSTATPSQITSEMAAIKNAYSHDGGNAGLFEDDGSPTTYFFDSGRTLGGVRIENFSIIEGVGASYVTFIRFSFQVVADFPAIESDIEAWEETLTFVGDAGPITAWQTPIKGPPVRQQLTDRSTQRIIQSGTAVGFSAPIAPPPPRYPSIELRDRRQIVTGTPAIQNKSANTYPTRWSYEFESPVDLSGNGTVRPQTR